MSEARESAPLPAANLADRRRVIGVLGVTQILAWGSTFYLPAVLAAPISADTGWPLPLVVGGLALGLLVSGIVSPRVGRLIGRHGGRPVLALSAVLIGGGLLVLASSHTLAVFGFGWLLIGVGMGAGLYDAAFATLGRIYGRGARRTIVTLTLFGGFASTICWPFSAFLLASFGWRGTCLAYAGIQLLFTLPLYLLFLPPTRLPASGASLGEEARRAGPLLQGHERPLFLLLSVAATIGGGTTAVVGVHVLTLLQARGFDMASAVALAALIGPAQVAGRVGEMLFGRRYHPIITLLSACSFMLTGLVLLMLNAPLVGGALVLYGAGSGLHSIARGTVPLALFSEDSYAPLMGRLALPIFMAQAAGPPAAAMLLKTSGATTLLAILAAFAATNLALAVVLWLMSRSGAAG